MATVRIKLNSAGIQALLQSREMQEDLLRRAEAIARSAGPGMQAGGAVVGDRAVARVWTATDEARRAEAERRALTLAIDAGR